MLTQSYQQLTTCSKVASTIDLLPSIAKLAGAKIPVDRVVDGKDISPLMFAEHGAESPHNYFFYYIANELQAVRSGQWKLRRAKGNTELFNLDHDISETNNLAKHHPDIAGKLTKVMKVFDSRLMNERRPAGRLE